MAITALKFNSRFNAPFFGGAGASSLVPGKFPIAIAGHAYQVIWEKEAIEVWGAKYKSIAQPLLRAQSDQSNTPGENSISPENFWRRSQENWVNGSGQFQQDRKGSSDPRFNSSESRFYTSKGINPWTPFQASLLNSTTLKKSSINSNLQVVVVGVNLYFNDGGTLSVSTDGGGTWNAVTGITGTVNSICSDGTNLYAASTSALYTVAGSVATSYLTQAFTLLAYVKGRLMAVQGTALYNITGTPPTGVIGSALITKLAGFKWVAFAGGQSQIYAVGYAGTQSSVWRISIQADGTTLTAPINAGDLPTGEVISSIYSYLGYVFIGSSLGVRFCTVASDGSLNMGPLIPTISSVYCFDGQGSQVWYGLSNFDSASTGLGRIDLTTFQSTSSLTPAYASDLMAGTSLSNIQGAVRSVQLFSGYHIFTVDGYGIYIENLSTPVATGTLTTGWSSYNLIDPKLALFLDIAHLPLNGAISASFAADNGSSVVVGNSGTAGSTSPGASFQLNQKLGFQFQIQFTLTPSANISPVLTRWTLRSYPTPTRSNQFHVPIDLSPIVIVNGQEVFVDVPSEVKFLRSLLVSQQVVSYQEGKENFNVVMYDYQWLPRDLDPKTGYMIGIFYAMLNQVTS